MAPVHLSPAEAVRAHQVLKAKHSMAIHFGTFTLADDGQEEPLVELDQELKNAGLSQEDFWVLEFGQGREVPPFATMSAKQTLVSN
jgi:L-ascorbate metabolism protein UlaG (beta-lactamase superfamily)